MVATGANPGASPGPSLAAPSHLRTTCSCARQPRKATGACRQLAARLAASPTTFLPVRLRGLEKDEDDTSRLAGAVGYEGREEAAHLARVLWLADFTRFMHMRLEDRYDLMWHGVTQALPVCYCPTAGLADAAGHPHQHDVPQPLWSPGAHLCFLAPSCHFSSASTCTALRQHHRHRYCHLSPQLSSPKPGDMRWVSARRKTAFQGVWEISPGLHGSRPVCTLRSQAARPKGVLCSRERVRGSPWGCPCEKRNPSAH